MSIILEYSVSPHYEKQTTINTR